MIGSRVFIRLDHFIRTICWFYLLFYLAKFASTVPHCKCDSKMMSTPTPLPTTTMPPRMYLKKNNQNDIMDIEKTHYSFVKNEFCRLDLLSLLKLIYICI